MWQPLNWVQMLQPIANLFTQIVQRFASLTQEQLADVTGSVTILQRAAHTFKQLGHCSGERNLTDGLGNLAR